MHGEHVPVPGHLLTALRLGQVLHLEPRLGLLDLAVGEGDGAAQVEGGEGVGEVLDGGQEVKEQEAGELQCLRVEQGLLRVLAGLAADHLLGAGL